MTKYLYVWMVTCFLYVWIRNSWRWNYKDCGKLLMWKWRLCRNLNIISCSFEIEVSIIYIYSRYFGDFQRKFQNTWNFFFTYFKHNWNNWNITTIMNGIGCKRFQLNLYLKRERGLRTLWMRSLWTLSCLSQENCSPIKFCLLSKMALLTTCQ